MNELWRAIRGYLRRTLLSPLARARYGSAWNLLGAARLRYQKSVIRRSDYFDSQWYLASNPDVRAAGIDPAYHYLRYGSDEARNPSDEFDGDYYAAGCVDVATLPINPLVHFEVWGQREGLKPGPGEWRSSSSPAAPTQDEVVRLRHSALGTNIDLDAAVLGIGIVTYNNSPAQIARLLQSIEVSRAKLPERIKVAIFVIDNGGPTNLMTELPVRQVSSRGNIGFAAAHNLLMQEAFAAMATHYIAANPDGCFHPDCLEALIRMCQAAGNHALVEALQFPDEHPKAYDPYSFETPWATGTCLVISRDVFDAIGGFDASFFMYCEDVDLSWRARSAGMAVKICPRALYMHHIQFRDYDRARHHRFLISGLILARKWGNSTFEKRMLAEMKKYKFSTDGVPLPDRLEDNRSVTDFDHLFSFAPTRWT